jgi:hypothetical protein
MPLPEGQVWERRPVMPSSETETHSRGCLALDQDGASREGVRPALERSPLGGGGDRPTSEADLYRGGVAPLERSGVLPEGWQGRLSDGPWAREFVLCMFFTSLSGFPLVVLSQNTIHSTSRIDFFFQLFHRNRGFLGEVQPLF